MASRLFSVGDTVSYHGAIEAQRGIQGVITSTNQTGALVRGLGALHRSRSYSWEFAGLRLEESLEARRGREGPQPATGPRPFAVGDIVSYKGPNPVNLGLKGKVLRVIPQTVQVEVKYQHQQVRNFKWSASELHLEESVEDRHKRLGRAPPSAQPPGPDPRLEIGAFVSYHGTHVEKRGVEGVLVGLEAGRALVKVLGILDRSETFDWEVEGLLVEQSAADRIAWQAVVAAALAPRAQPARPPVAPVPRARPARPTQTPEAIEHDRLVAERLQKDEAALEEASRAKIARLLQEDDAQAERARVRETQERASLAVVARLQAEREEQERASLAVVARLQAEREEQEKASLKEVARLRALDASMGAGRRLLEELDQMTPARPARSMIDQLFAEPLVPQPTPAPSPRSVRREGVPTLFTLQRNPAPSPRSVQTPETVFGQELEEAAAAPVSAFARALKEAKAAAASASARARKEAAAAPVFSVGDRVWINDSEGLGKCKITDVQPAEVLVEVFGVSQWVPKWKVRKAD